MARRRPTKAPPVERTFDWKNHPIIIASGSAAATFILSLAIFTQLVAPTQTAKLEIEILKLKESRDKAEQNYSLSVGENKVVKDKNSNLTKEVEALKAKINALQQETVDLRASNLFSPENPYPNGLGLVRIGMPSSEINKVFYDYKITRNEDSPNIVWVALKGYPFDRITYFLDGRETITHVSFDMPVMGSKHSEYFLHNKLVEAFGTPAATIGTKKFNWNIGTKYSIYAHDKRSFVLMKRGQEPIFWTL